MEKYGIDVSAWQGSNFDFNKAIAEGVQFVILKAGGSDGKNGARYTDRYFNNFYNKCKNLGISVGCYFYGEDMTINNAKDSAYYFANLLQGKVFDLGVYYDVEAKMLTLNRRDLTDIVNSFTTTLKPFSDIVGVYASLDTFKNKLYNTELGNIKRWVACWGNVKPTSINTDIWQYSSSNIVAGVRCDTDKLYFSDNKKIEVPKATIKKGDTGDNVKNLQLALNYVLNANLVVDGIYGNKTETAVQDFQRKILCNGVYDDHTYTKLMEVLK